MIDLIKKNKIKVTEAARLLKVSRVAVSCWVNKRKAPHHFIAPLVDEFLASVNRAEEAGDLPLTDVPNPERLDKLREVLSKHGMVFRD